MLNFTTEEINNAYKKVNPKVQEILNADWVSEDIGILGKNLNLRINQVAELIKLVGFVFLRLIPLSKLIENIENELEVSHERATEIAEKVDEVIFSKVRSEIFEMRESIRQPKQSIISSDRINKDETVSPIDEQEAFRDSLLKEIEEHAQKESTISNSVDSVENLEDNEIMADKINKVVTNDLTEKKIDPYREQI